MTLVTVLFVLLTPLWAALIHAILTRSAVAARLPRQKLALLSCLIAVTAVTYSSLALELWLGTSLTVGALFPTLLSALLAHVYFHIFNMSETARRIRLLFDVREGKKPSRGNYGNQEMIAVRLERLYELNQVRLWNGKYFSRPTILRWVCRCVRRHEQLLFPGRFTNPRS